jgi:hypothetical protein
MTSPEHPRGDAWTASGLGVVGGAIGGLSLLSFRRNASRVSCARAEMTGKLELAGMRPRGIGAIAGLAPALLVAILFVAFGSPAPTREFILPLVGITVLAVVAGWLVGPLAKGSFRADLTALVTYSLVSALIYLPVGAVGSAWNQTTTSGTPDLMASAGTVAGLLLYGLLYAPFWAVFVAPFALVWVGSVRVLRLGGPSIPPELAEPHEPGRANQFRAARPRRLSLITAAIIALYGLFVALIPLLQQDHGTTPPWAIDRPIALFGLFAVPAVVAGIGAVRGARPLLIAAGVACLLQAYISFSGVTLGFIVPAAVLLWLGAAERWSPEEPTASRAMLLAVIAIVGLTIAAWVALFALTEPRCWAASQAADGTITVVEVQATNTMLYGSSEIPSGGGGCSSAELTIQGMGVSAVLAIGAIALAAAAGSAGRETHAT